MSDLKWRVADEVEEALQTLFDALDKLQREGHSDKDILYYLSWIGGRDIADAYTDWIEEGANNG